MTSTAAPRRSRRLLVPLATLVAATGIALASGATFSTSTASDGMVVSGTLHQTNSNSVAFSGSNLKPGDVVTGSVTITNDGSLPAVFTLTETGRNDFSAGVMNLSIAQDGVVLSDKDLGKAGKLSLGQFAVDEKRTYTYTVTFASTASNLEQKKLAETRYTFDALQTNGGAVSSTPGVVTQDGVAR